MPVTAKMTNMEEFKFSLLPSEMPEWGTEEYFQVFKLQQLQGRLDRTDLLLDRHDDLVFILNSYKSDIFEIRHSAGNNGLTSDDKSLIDDIRHEMRASIHELSKLPDVATLVERHDRLEDRIDSLASEWNIDSW